MKKKSIVILTGAGISAESGLATFRASDGLWENHRIEDVATPEGFECNPDLVHQFYNERRRKLIHGHVQPNPAHLALSELDRKYQVTIVTQNIDNLHERAGSMRVIHIHGEILKSLCRFCRTRFDVSGDLSTRDICDECGRIGGIRPDIVWFGEIPYRMEEIVSFIEKCGLFLAIGTSGNVYPAAGFVDIARRFGARTLEINLEATKSENLFDEHRYGMAGSLVPELVKELLK